MIKNVWVNDNGEIFNTKREAVDSEHASSNAMFYNMEGQRITWGDTLMKTPWFVMFFSAEDYRKWENMKGSNNFDVQQYDYYDVLEAIEDVGYVMLIFDPITQKYEMFDGEEDVSNIKKLLEVIEEVYEP